jgi:hypothetical protein
MTAFLEWVQRTFTVDYQKEIEQYLAESINHYDLERRMQNLQRRGMI